MAEVERPDVLAEESTAEKDDCRHAYEGESGWCVVFLSLSLSSSRVGDVPLLILMGSSLIAKRVLSFTAKYLNRVEVIRLANVVSSSQLRQISFFKCSTA